MFMLVDGIYPAYSRFVKGIKNPTTPQESSYTKWQEASRKDIERAFGVLQGHFNFMSRPVMLPNLPLITMRVTTCLILHNMGVSDRIMNNDCKAIYNPAERLEQDEEREVAAHIGGPAVEAGAVH